MPAARRAPGRNAWSTNRKEGDVPELLSGLVDGKTCGAPIAMFIRNSDQHSRDYSGLKRTPRPSHADYTALVKYGGSYDVRGGGQFSGRLTAPQACAERYPPHSGNSEERRRQTVFHPAKHGVSHSGGVTALVLLDMLLENA